MDEPFEVTTLLGEAVVRDNDNGEFPSFEVVPLPLVFDTTARTMELSVFAQLPDKAYALWDWTSGNESCPATDSGDDVPECHKFEAHMGWLNSNHFLPQAGKVFRRYHDLAVQRAGACQQMAATLSVAGRDEPGLLQACDREAMLLEAIAQHYLQDAWSMGHMWQRWGSPDLADFAGALSTRPDLGDIDAIGDAVGRGSGIIHGAKAITHIADAMCAPDDGIEFVFDGSVHAGAGDLYLERVEADERFVDQHDFLFGCSTTAMREVYLASAQSFGPAGASQAAEMDLNECFTQRATNRAVGLGSAIQIPILLTDFATAIASQAVALNLVLADTSDEYLRSLGLDSFGRSDFYLPLTSEMLTTIDMPGIVIPKSVRTRWHEDMRRIQGFLAFSAPLDPKGINLANGELGPLLGMETNGFYEEKAARSPYADPPLPWTPTPTDQPLPSTVANAANILSRTFREAHVEDWCGVLHEDGDDEFSLTKLRDTCTDVAAQGGAADAVCAVCASFAEWMVFDPDGAASPAVSGPPICNILANNPGIMVTSAPGDFDRAALATRWCHEEPLPGIGPVAPVWRGPLVYSYSETLSNSDPSVLFSRDEHMTGVLELECVGSVPSAVAVTCRTLSSLVQHIDFSDVQQSQATCGFVDGVAPCTSDTTCPAGAACLGEGIDGTPLSTCTRCRGVRVVSLRDSASVDDIDLGSGSEPLNLSVNPSGGYDLTFAGPTLRLRFTRTTSETECDLQGPQCELFTPSATAADIVDEVTGPVIPLGMFNATATGTLAALPANGALVGTVSSATMEATFNLVRQ